MIGSATQVGTQLKAAWGAHLGRYPWTHFATLTFSQESVQDYARRQFLSFVRRVERDAGPTYWFYGTEFGKLGRMHLHALLGRTELMTRDELQEHWPCGFSRFLPYDSQLGAAHYVSKYITKDLADYDVSPGFPNARALYVGRQRELAGIAPRLAIAPGEREPRGSHHSRRQRRRPT